MYKGKAVQQIQKPKSYLENIILIEFKIDLPISSSLQSLTTQWLHSRVPAFFWNLAALQHMNWYCRLITNLKYLCKILIHYDPQASWIYFINVLLCSDFSRLVGCGGSIFYWDIRDLWSVYNTNSCIELPQDSKKMLVTYSTCCKHMNLANRSAHWQRHEVGE